MPANTEQELVREIFSYVGLHRNQIDAVLQQYPELTIRYFTRNTGTVVLSCKRSWKTVPPSLRIPIKYAFAG